MKFQHINQLCELVRETAFAIHPCHRHFGTPRLFEKKYALSQDLDLL